MDRIASDLERMVMEWLDKRNILYDFQSSLLGGRPEYGGIIADFILIEEGIVLRIQGEYWHTGIVEEARDREQRVVLESMGYRVVDLQEQDLKDNIDLVMEKALIGDEMSPIYSDLFTGNIGGVQDVAGNLGDHSSSQLPSHGGITVRTETYDGELQGFMFDSGGLLCDCRFKWATASSEASPLCYIFPWKFYNLYNLFSPEINLDFGVVATQYSNTTAWQSPFGTGDDFSQAINTTSGQLYSYYAQAKNDLYSDDGTERIFVGA